MKTYIIAPDGASIFCCRCQMRSYHAEDIAKKYCGECHAFHDDGPMIKTQQQYEITKAEAQKFNDAIEEMESYRATAMHLRPQLYNVYLDALRSQLADLQEEMREYESKIVPGDADGRDGGEVPAPAEGAEYTDELDRS